MSPMLHNPPGFLPPPPWGTLLAPRLCRRSLQTGRTLPAISWVVLIMPLTPGVSGTCQHTGYLLHIPAQGWEGGGEGCKAPPAAAEGYGCRGRGYQAGKGKGYWGWGGTESFQSFEGSFGHHQLLWGSSAAKVGTMKKLLIVFTQVIIFQISADSFTNFYWEKFYNYLPTTYWSAGRTCE